MKVLEYKNQTNSERGCYAIWCPACKNEHPFDKNRWKFDGNFEKPTFEPSMLIKIGPMPKGHPDEGKYDICHSFVRGGQIIYLSDCTHDLAGQTIDLPDIPEHILAGTR